MNSSPEESQFLDDRVASSMQPPTVLASFFALFGILAVSAAIKFISSNGPKIPIALADTVADRKKRVDQYRVDSRNILVQGYTKFKGQIFGIDTSEGTNFVLPTDFMDELKSHPALSFAGTFETLTLPEYTQIKPMPQEALKVFSGKINPALGDFLPEQQKLFRDELSTKLPLSDDWNAVKIYPILFHMVCKSTARTLLGEEAAQNNRWLELEDEYISTAIPYIQGLKKWPKFMRPFVYKNVDGYETLNKQWAEGKAIIADYLEKKKAADWKPLQHPPSFFDHITAKFRDISVDDHLAMQITLFIAGVHTSAATSTNALFDATVNSACIDEIREEVKSVHEQSGGTWTRQNLGQLLKLDSFIKEVARFSSPDLTTFCRKSSDEVVLSNGFRIPKGVKLEIATGAIHMDEEKYDNPRVFDGLRFWRMRQREDQALKHQFVAVGKDDLGWGYGRHACPGRYMADVTIKLLLAEFLLQFEIKNPAGKGRHPNAEFDGQTMCDTEAEVLVKKIKP